jgi:hypothetical protein
MLYVKLEYEELGIMLVSGSFVDGNKDLTWFFCMKVEIQLLGVMLEVLIHYYLEDFSWRVEILPFLIDFSS